MSHSIEGDQSGMYLDWKIVYSSADLKALGFSCLKVMVVGGNEEWLKDAGQQLVLASSPTWLWVAVIGVMAMTLMGDPVLRVQRWNHEMTRR